MEEYLAKHSKPKPWCYTNCSQSPSALIRVSVDLVILFLVQRGKLPSLMEIFLWNVNFSYDRVTSSHFQSFFRICYLLKVTTLRASTMAQWVKYLTAAAQVSGEAWDWSPAQHSGVRIQCCYSYDIGCSCSSNSTPGPGISIYLGCGQK